MPCDSYIQADTDLKVADRDILRKAAEAMGLQVSGNVIITKEGRRITIDGKRAQCDQRDLDIVDKLRVAYANEVIKHVAQKFSWQKVVKGTNKYQIVKGV